MSFQENTKRTQGDALAFLFIYILHQLYISWVRGNRAPPPAYLGWLADQLKAKGGL
jgi:hypothetical protein